MVPWTDEHAPGFWDSGIPGVFRVTSKVWFTSSRKMTSVGNGAAHKSGLKQPNEFQLRDRTGQQLLTKQTGSLERF